MLESFGDNKKSFMDTQIITFNSCQVKLSRMIGQGGYSFVYSAVELVTHTQLAVKKFNVKESKYKNLADNEIKILKLLKSSPYIIRYIDDIIISKQFHYLLLEFCPISLYSYINKRIDISFDNIEIIKILAQITKALNFMHTHTPVIIHRDLKVENILISDKLFIKLCDFGSSTFDSIDPNFMTHQEKCYYEEKLKEITTPQYRAPEMIDFYLNYIINEKADIWALGVIFFYISYFQFPFDDESRMSILNIHYKNLLSSSIVIEGSIKPLIRRIFLNPPQNRPSTIDLLQEIQNIACALSINIDDPVLNINPIIENEKKIFNLNTQNVIDSVMNKAGNIIDSIKGTGQKIKAQINQNKKQQLQFLQFITKKIAIITCSIKQFITNINDPKIDSIITYLKTHYTSNFVIVTLDNINNEDYPIGVLENRVYSCNFNTRHAPNITELLKLLNKIVGFLSKNIKRIVVFHCSDGGYLSLYISCLLMAYGNVITKFESYFEQLLVNHYNYIKIPFTHPTYIRYAKYICKLKNSGEINLLQGLIHLQNIKITPILLCNHDKSKCRPFVTVSINNTVTYSSSNDPSMLKEYSSNDTCINIDLDVYCQSNITVTIYHASIVDNKYCQKYLFSFSFHSGFLQPMQPYLQFYSKDLDIMSPIIFQLIHNIHVTLSFTTGIATNFLFDEFTTLVKSTHSNIFFLSSTEQEQFIQKYSNISNSSESGSDMMILRYKSLVNENDIYSKESDSLDNSPLPNKNDLVKQCNTPIVESDELINLFTNKIGKQQDIMNDLLETSNISNFTQLSSSKNSQSINTSLPSSKNSQSINTSLPSSKNSQSINTSLPSSKNNENNIDMISFEDNLSKVLSADTMFLNPCDNSNKSLFTQNQSTNWSNVSLNEQIKFKSPTYVSNPPQFTKPVQHNIQFIKPVKFDHNTKPSTKTTTTSTKSNTPNNNKFTTSDMIFDDILNQHGFENSSSSFKNTTPKTTLDEARRLQQELLDQDPVAKKIKQWSTGKRLNIRALLTTLHLIIWPNDKWISPTLNDIKDYESVKKYYRRACLLVHPDKAVGTDREELAKAIFCELNEAWNAFESKGGKIF